MKQKLALNTRRLSDILLIFYMDFKGNDAYNAVLSYKRADTGRVGFN